MGWIAKWTLLKIKKKEAEGIFPECSTSEQALGWLGKEASQHWQYRLCCPPDTMILSYREAFWWACTQNTNNLTLGDRSSTYFFPKASSSQVSCSFQVSHPLVKPLAIIPIQYVHAHWTRDAALGSALWDHFSSPLQVRHAQSSMSMSSGRWYLQDWTQAGQVNSMSSHLEHLLLLHCLRFTWPISVTLWRLPNTREKIQTWFTGGSTWYG